MEQQDRLIVAFSFLPTSVQSRLSTLPSFGRSASLSILPSGRWRSAPAQGDGQESRVTTTDVPTTSNDEKAVVELPPSYEPTPRSLPGRRAQPGAAQDLEVQVQDRYFHPDFSCGINWRYANQGSHMQRSAFAEKDDADFARKSYIDGLAYMLQALPDDLDEHESTVLRRALPKPCAHFEAATTESSGAPAVTAGSHHRQGGQEGESAWRLLRMRGTFLQSAVAGLVAGLLMVVHLVLTATASAVRVGAQYERQYHFSQQLVSRGFVLATAVGRHSVVLSAKICEMSDGWVGRLVSDLAAWTAESVTAGIQDGIGHGLVMIDQKRR
ncbi:hypothetical protein F4780DRAFT_163493 [Xylariomycetidae sp. FL0641]|nr:hypothetical protein F4780DRAFT_163493 [Xylariomycetidae sp. FL0641]